MDIIVKELKDIKEILLQKVNKTTIGAIPIPFLKTQARNFDDIDNIELEIPKFIQSQIGKTKEEYPLYYEFITERIISLDGESFVIKNVKTDDSKNIKTIKAYGLEKRLEKNNFVMSNKGLALVDKNLNDEVYSFDECLYKDTGWKLGHIDHDVRYMENGEPKIRIQEDTNTSYYSFITETIAEQFCCVPVFDRKNKLINLFSLDGFGDRLGIILSKDNYIQSKERTDDSSDIITQLVLEGNDEKCIVEDANPTGFNYIENYSYFIEIGEMSKELQNALNKFEELTIERTKTWKELTQKKEELWYDLSNKQTNENIILAQIEQYENIIKAYEDLEDDETSYDFTDYENNLYNLREEQAQLSSDIATLEKQYEIISNDINNINKLLRRETSTDKNGNLLFTQELLDELKDFTYRETYSDDSFVDASELIKTGKQQLELKCRPTTTFSISSVDFTKRLVNNRFRQNWNGRIGLGDVVILYDKKTKVETYIYLVGWEKNYDEGSLNLTFSNKKTNQDSTKKISDLLRESKNNKNIIQTNKWLWNNQKYGKVETDLISDIDLNIGKEPPEITDSKYIKEIKLDVTEITLSDGEKYILTPTIIPENAQNRELIWISSNENIAIVKDGVIEALDYGKCIITVLSKDNNKSASCTVKIGNYDENQQEINVTGIRLSSSNLILDKNESKYLVASVVPLDATNQNITYYSEDTSIATVDETGLVTGVSSGTCRINAVSSENANIKTSCLVNVSSRETQLDYINLNGALLLGDDRIHNMNDNEFFNGLSVIAKEGINATYFYEDMNINLYPQNPTCVITMLGINDLTSLGMLYYKNLLSKLKQRYPSKKIFVAQELPVGVNYKDDIYSYATINSNIEKFNTELKTYCELEGINIINVSSGLVVDGLLNLTYSKNGYYLTNNGYKLLRNNISSQVLDVLNQKEELPSYDENNTEQNSLCKERQLIIARAEEIVKMCQNKKAWYSQYNRTTDWNNKQIIRYSSETISSQGVKKTYSQPSWAVGKAYGFDCSSFVGVCYQAAGYDFAKGLSCAGGTLQSMAKKHKALAWRYIDTQFEQALPGDIVMFANDSVTVTKDNMFSCKTHHTAIYMGEGYIAEAIGYTSGIQKRKRKTNDKWFFFRIEELQKADLIGDTSNNSTQEGTNCFDESGTIDGNNYIYRFANARCTAYGSSATTGAGGNLEIGKTCGCHNLPYGTKLYIPALKGKFGNSTGIYTCRDTGGYTTDFDLLIASTESKAESLLGNPINTDVYVLKWGDGKVAWSFTEAIEWCNKYYGVGYFHTSWTYYMKYGGCTINFWKFKDDDKDIKSESWYNKL